MRSTILPVTATACLMLSVFGPGIVQAETDEVKPGWGKPADGIRAGLVAEKTKIESGDRDLVEITLHIRNDSQKKVTLSQGGHGWGWGFHLIGAGATFGPTDDPAAGAPAPPQPITLEPGASQRLEMWFSQRWFRKRGSGRCSLLPGKYRVSAWYAEYIPGTTPRKIRRQITSGTAEFEILPRGNDWDKVATADATKLVGMLGDKDGWLREAAAAFLVGKGKEATPALLDGLQNGNHWSRQACATILGSLRKDADPAVVNALARALSDKESGVVIEAARSLGGFYGAAKPAIPALIAVARNRDRPKAQLAAVRALGWIGDARPEVVATLVELLGDPWIEYHSVAYAIAALGPKAKGAAPALVKDLQEKGSLKCGYALSALQRMGPAAAPAVPTLIRILEDEKEDVNIRAKALGVLANAPGKEALPALERVRDRHRGVSQDDLTMKAFFTGIDRTIRLIRGIESQSPGEPGDVGKAQP